MPVTTQQFSYNQDYWHAVLAVGREVGVGGVRGGAGAGRVWAARGQGRREGVMKTFTPELHQFERGRAREVSHVGGSCATGRCYLTNPDW